MIIETNALLGREQEVAAVDRFLAEVEQHPAALTFEGEPGIGKTVLVAHAVDKAPRGGSRVLAARPTSAESSLSFVGLTDLLSDAHELFAKLPSPQRRALEVALLLAEPVAAESPEPRAIGTGLLGVLRGLARSSPVVVAVDDLQWLDQPSAAALSFALRRVTNESIGLLAAIRGQPEAAAAELVGSVRGERLSLGPLSAGAIQALLAERLELSIPRWLLLRIHESCRGNPLFALEIGRALRERGLPKPTEPFDIPADLEALFASRLEQLPEDTLDALAVAAASVAPSRSLVGRISTGLLDPAIRRDIIRLEGQRIHFTHPLLASAVYARLDPETRRVLHRRIANAVTNREEGARHLALAAETPDSDVAAALDDAADQAGHRGAPAVAAELAELAVKLTPPCDTDRLHVRKRIAAQYYFLAGDVSRARTILEPLIDQLPHGIEWARALLQLADTREEVKAVRSLCEDALAEAGGDQAVFVDAHRKLAQQYQLTGNNEQAVAHARQAVAAAEQTGDPRLLASSLSYVALFEVTGGRVTSGVLERALGLERQAGYLRHYESPAMVDALRLMLLNDDLDGARERLSRAEVIARNHGDDEARIALLLHLAEVECRSGRFEDAARAASNGYELAHQLGLEGSEGALLYVVALADASRGRVESAREAAERGLALAEKTANEMYANHNSRVLGFLALSAGEWSTAARYLAPLPKRLATRGYGRASALRITPDAIEALIAVGERDRAAEHLEELEQTATVCEILYARARAARCRGLLASSEGDYAAAFIAFDEALKAHERLPDPIERGRTLFALGQTQRRAGRKRDARETLQQALAIFGEICAALWAEQTQGELERLGGRTPSPDVLTGAEERVARLVAEGKTNREVAAALFVTERTVETHLTSIYRKLDLRSRTELAGHLAGRTS